MQALISLRFPHYRKDVLVQVFVPLPEQRPHAVANFIFAITGQLPPPDMLTALRLDAAQAMPVTMADAAAARAAGLVPFADTAVVRVEKGGLIEMGSSTTKTIFGGFLRDEPVELPKGPARGSLASTMMQRPAGVILCGNMGMPNTQASRYYVLLKAAADPSRTAEQREELQSYAPLGMITSGLDDLIAASEVTQVHARTLAPTKKVEMVGCRLDFDYRGLSRKLRETGLMGAVGTNTVGGAGAAASHQRTAGRVRGRDDDEATAEANADGDETSGGFFQFNVHFPERSAASAVRGNAKRRRAEAMTLDEDGQPVLRTTAVHLENGVPVNGDEKGQRQFDYFGSQDAVFWNDIDEIKDQQTLRHNRHASRSAKFSKASQRKQIISGSAARQKKKSSDAGPSVLGKVSTTKKKRPAGKRY